MFLATRKKQLHRFTRTKRICEWIQLVAWTVLAVGVTAAWPW